MSGVVSGFFPVVGWAIFLGALALSIALGVILGFHWFSYARNDGAALTASIVYGAGCLVIIIMLLGAVMAL